MKKKFFIAVLALVMLFTVALTACKDKDTPPEDPITYTIIFNATEGSQVSSISFDSAQQTVTLPQMPTKDGYDFEGWYFDNGTFNEPVTLNALIGKFSKTNTSVTVYAKWALNHENSREALLDALMLMYDQTIALNRAKEFTAAEEQRLGEVEDEIIALEDPDFDWIEDENEIDKHYWADVYLFDCKSYRNALRFKEIIDGVDGDWSALSQDDWETLEDIKDEMYLEDDLMTVYEVSILSRIQYGTDDHYDLILEFYTLLDRKFDNEEYTENKDDFRENAQEFLNTIGADDIRKEKLLLAADAIKDYDYAKMRKESGDGYDYVPEEYADFILFIRSASTFTNDDMGMLYYKLSGYLIDKLISGCQEGLAEAEEELAGAEENELSEYEVQYLEEEIANYQEDIDLLETLKEELTLETLTVFADYTFGVLDIVNSNGVFDALFGTIEDSEEEYPTLEELATVIGSFKDACDDLRQSYIDGAFGGVTQALKDVLEALAETENDSLYFIDFIMPLLEERDYAETLKISSDVLALFTKENLDVFLNEEENEGKRIIVYDGSNPYIMENFVILEAKLLMVFVQNEYDADKLNSAYDKVIELIEYYIPLVLPMSPAEEDYYGMDTEELAYIVLDMAAEALRNNIIVSEAQFNRIKDISVLAFNTQASPLTDSDMIYDTLVLGNFNAVTERAQMINDILGDTLPVDYNISLAIAGAVTAFDLDFEKVKTALEDSLEYYNNSNPEEIFTVKIFNIAGICFDAGLTDDEIINILSFVAHYAARLAELYYPNLEMENDNLQEIVTALSTERGMTDAFAYLVVKYIHAVSDYIEQNTGDLGSMYDFIVEVLYDVSVEVEARYGGSGYDMASLMYYVLLGAKEYAVIDERLDEFEATSIFIAVINYAEQLGFDGFIDRIQTLAEIYRSDKEILEDDEDEYLFENFTFSAKLYMALLDGIDRYAIIDAAGTGTMPAEIICAVLSNNFYNKMALVAELGYCEEGDENKFDILVKIQGYCGDMIYMIMYYYDTHR